MSDIAIMNAGGISVPIFTTYSSNDYEYILNDCKPSLIIVSNNDQFKKIKKYIDPKEQKIISFEKIEIESLMIKDILDEKNFDKKINQSLKRNMPACIIYTSGTANLFKAGIPIGIISSNYLSEEKKIEFFSDFSQLKFVKIVSFKKNEAK